MLNEKYVFNITGTKELSKRPIIVGSGPAGLFAAYIRAENGYRPLVIERGEKIEDRINSVEEFWKTGLLNKESNVSFVKVRFIKENTSLLIILKRCKSEGLIKNISPTPIVIFLPLQLCFALPESITKIS